MTKKLKAGDLVLWHPDEERRLRGERDIGDTTGQDPGLVLEVHLKDYPGVLGGSWCVKVKWLVSGIGPYTYDLDDPYLLKIPR